MKVSKNITKLANAIAKIAIGERLPYVMSVSGPRITVPMSVVTS